MLIVVIIVVVLMDATAAAVCVRCDVDDVDGYACVELCADCECCADFRLVVCMQCVCGDYCDDVGVDCDCVDDVVDCYEWCVVDYCVVDVLVV